MLPAAALLTTASAVAVLLLLLPLLLLLVLLLLRVGVAVPGPSFRHPTPPTVLAGHVHAGAALRDIAATAIESGVSMPTEAKPSAKTPTDDQDTSVFARAVLPLFGKVPTSKLRKSEKPCKCQTDVKGTVVGLHPKSQSSFLIIN